MCCQIRSSTITSPRIVNNCLSLSIIVFQGISVIAMTHDHFENASTTLHNVFPSNNPAKLVCNQRYKGIAGLSGCQTSNHLTILISFLTEKICLSDASSTPWEPLAAHKCQTERKIFPFLMQYSTISSQN
ncbi:hypothetical protein Tsp_06570 [Trichinella spiralis]|uniref:hypothetical protein n=1 Tax=Trichinella spiralis TaxID=6334 RepID=UPI0001EFCED9|nr:hypothetical protein Tsp_06570 [Trichinella spiralis]